MLPTSALIAQGRSRAIPRESPAFPAPPPDDSLAGVASTDYFYGYDATCNNLVGHFSVVGNSVTFTVDSLTSDRSFADSSD